MRWRLVVLVVVAWVVVLGSQPVGALGSPLDVAFVPTYDSTAGGDLVGHTLTADGSDSYHISRSGSTETVAAAPGNTGGNHRSVLTAADGPMVEDAESCATWTSYAGEISQMGAAFRLRLGPGTRVRGITITQNILFGARWLYHVHVWDTARSPAMALVATFEVPAEGETALQPPLRFCGRTIGDTVSMKVWQADQPEPAWGDPSAGGSAPLPVSARGAGQTGWYVGHLKPGDSAVFDHLTAGTAPTVRPAWYPFASAVRFVQQQDLDLSGAPSSPARTRAAAAAVTSPEAAAARRSTSGWTAGGPVAPSAVPTGCTKGSSTARPTTAGCAIGCPGCGRERS